MKLLGKVAIVTGASRGIGSAISEELASLGANVVLNYISYKEGAIKVLDNIKMKGGYGSIIQGDVSNYRDAGFLVEETIKTYGKLDILINNAGISKPGLFIDMKEQDWDELLNVNLKGVINCTHHGLKYMIPKKIGCIVNVSSMWGSAGGSCEAIYSATKGGVDSFTKALAKELAPSNIRVNAVAPGVIETNMNSFLSRDEKATLESEIPLGYFGKSVEVAKVVAFLCSEDSSYITGQVVNVNGGIL